MVPTKRYLQLFMTIRDFVNYWWLILQKLGTVQELRNVLDH